MKTQQHPKLKTTPRPFFSCGFFCHCNNTTTLSPTTPHSPTPLPLPPPPPPPPPPPQKPESSSSSSSTSQSSSFTQWKFPLSNSPTPTPQFKPTSSTFPPPLESLSFSNLEQLFHLAQLQLTDSTHNQTQQLAALHLLERSLVPNPPLNSNPPPDLIRSLLRNLRNPPGAKSAAKILLALCLANGSRRVAVEVGAVGAVVDVVTELEDAAAERALAALELMCTVAEGARELKAHALAVPVMVSVMGRMVGRGREYAISVLGVVYGNGGGGGEEEEEELGVAVAPREEVARAVELAMERESECTARGRRKAATLLKLLKNVDDGDNAENVNVSTN